MDLPMGVLKALIILSQIDPLVLTKLVDMTPFNITQADSAHLLFPWVNQTGEDIIISKPIIGARKLSLDSTAYMIRVTNLALDNPKAVKSDNALTDNSPWNLRTLMPLSGRDQYIYLYLSKEYYKSTHGIVFDWIRYKMSWRFDTNVTNSTDRYLRLIYSTEEIVNGISDRGELEIDLEAIKDSVSQSKVRMFWDWYEGSSHFLWRWQPEVNLNMRDSTSIFVRKGLLPSSINLQQIPKEPALVEQTKDNINKLIARR